LRRHIVDLVEIRSATVLVAVAHALGVALPWVWAASAIANCGTATTAETRSGGTSGVAKIIVTDAPVVWLRVVHAPVVGLEAHVFVVALVAEACAPANGGVVGHGAHAHVAVDLCDAVFGLERPPTLASADGLTRDLVTEATFRNLSVSIVGHEAEGDRSNEELESCLDTHCSERGDLADFLVQS
jgi:hypothetical protein